MRLPLTILGFAAFAALTCAAADAVPAAEPVVLAGTTWSMAGKIRIKVKRLGKQTIPEEATVEFLSAQDVQVTNELSDLQYSGTYTTRGPRGTVVSADIDDTGLEQIRAYIEDEVEQVLADRGFPVDVTVTLGEAKFGGRVTPSLSKMKIASTVKFTVTPPFGPSAPGKLKLKMKRRPPM